MNAAMGTILRALVKRLTLANARRSTIDLIHRQWRLAACGFLLLLSACSVADNLSGHSVEYNRQAEIIKSQNLLLNVIRAAYRRPLQFTDLSTITGTVSFSTTDGLALPFAGQGTPRLFVANPAITTSNSPTYVVSVLNTKEFYDGILAPIPMQTVAYYIRTGFPKRVLLQLLISEIDYGPENAPLHVFNTPGNPEFTDLLDQLIHIGLNVEQADKTELIGEPFDQKQYPSAKDVADLEAKGIKIVRAKGRYQLEKTTSAARFCFDQSFAPKGVIVGPGTPIGATRETLKASDLCGASEAQPQNAASAEERRAGIFSLRPKEKDSAKPKPVLTLATHSTEGVIYYLGEIARNELGLAGRPTPLPGPQIFDLKPGAGGPGSIDVSYEGTDYHVDPDPTGRDRSSQVMELVLQLLAQNNSAKDLPAPSVIAITH